VFIYILNFLYDGLKKKNKIHEDVYFDIVNDTKYISQLAVIKKSFDFKKINNRIIDIFEILNKYNLNNEDSIVIINKLIKNNNNSWILENFYDSKDSELILSSIINNVINKNELREVCIAISC